ncbi:MAG: FMN-binding negative transcriptional regulator [Sphingobacteriales bacterium]|nr:MAG: FMN-binding negative transcriptional regulator [Sphingobacteriales bacterium]
MYKVPHFTETEQQEVIDFIKANPFATLIGNDGFTSVATQLPLIIHEKEGELYLQGHMMRKTDHCIAFEKNPNVLVMFTGPHCYVSASWYNERNTAGTWNYITVHARGTMQLMTDAETIKLLTDLTHKYEDSQTNPELVENMSDKYLHTHVKAIAGFEIKLTDLYPLFKLSQNRNDESYQNIVAHLNEGANDEKEIAAEMIKRRPQLFK